MTAALKVNEIYRTIMGEGVRAGRACTIVRLTGCNLRCKWCDTTYAYEQGTEMSVDDLLARVGRAAGGLVLLTGGEPLAQPAAADLLGRLCDAGLDVVLETNGSLDISQADPRACRCVDVKCPGSGEGGSFLPANLDHLRRGDEVKFVLADRADFDFAREFIRKYDLSARCAVILSPAAGAIRPAELAEWMLAEGDLPAGVRLGLQLHKIIWPEATQA